MNFGHEHRLFPPRFLDLAYLYMLGDVFPFCICGDSQIEPALRQEETTVVLSHCWDT